MVAAAKMQNAALMYRDHPQDHWTWAQKDLMMDLNDVGAGVAKSTPYFSSE